MRLLKFKARIKQTGETIELGRICMQCKKVYPWDNLATHYAFDQVEIMECMGQDKDGKEIYEEVI